MGNMHVKLYEIWTSGLGGDVVYRFYFFLRFYVINNTCVDNLISIS